ncbi:hypothetical protein [uncultured Caballeronia sp.]|jgi:hypothetical protein|uniref:hypothetical protein n=1 Tax=uncultured Caballeronia sp. TaxID=1827198 RepID=UPI00157704AB
MIQMAHILADQWLSERADNVGKIKDAIARMNDAPVQLDQASMIAALIQEGLTPVCVKCGRLSSQNMAVGDVRPGDEANWICRTCASDNSQYGHCRCCGENLLFSVDELDDQGLCQEHAGEFDLSPEEEEDWESYIENVQKGD